MATKKKIGPDVRKLLTKRLGYLKTGKQEEAKKIRTKLRKTYKFWISRDLPAESEFRATKGAKAKTKTKARAKRAAKPKRDEATVPTITDQLEEGGEGESPSSSTT